MNDIHLLNINKINKRLNSIYSISNSNLIFLFHSFFRIFEIVEINITRIDNSLIQRYKLL